MSFAANLNYKQQPQLQLLHKRIQRIESDRNGTAVFLFNSVSLPSKKRHTKFSTSSLNPLNRYKVLQLLSAVALLFPDPLKSRRAASPGNVLWLRGLTKPAALSSIARRRPRHSRIPRPSDQFFATGAVVREMHQLIADVRTSGSLIGVKVPCMPPRASRRIPGFQVEAALERRARNAVDRNSVQIVTAICQSVNVFASLNVP